MNQKPSVAQTPKSVQWVLTSDKLGRSPNTVRTQISTVFRKLGVNSKLELARCLETQNAPSAHSSEMLNSASNAWRHFQEATDDACSFDPSRQRRAISRFEEISEAWPEFAPAYSGISFCLRHAAFTATNRSDALDLLEAALVVSEKALRVNFFDASAHVSHGRVLALGGDIDGASEHFRLALELDPNSDWARYMAMQMMGETGPLSSCIELGRKTLSSAKEPAVLASVELTLAIAELRVGNKNEALSLARSCVARANAYDHMLYVAAIILSEVDDHGTIRQFADPRLLPAMTLSPLQRRYLQMNGDFFTLFSKHNSTVSTLCCANG